jgi:hypothetical protein
MYGTQLCLASRVIRVGLAPALTSSEPAGIAVAMSGLALYQNVL